MRYGFYLHTRGPTATRDGILALAREGERLGLHSAMIADHIVLPVESQSTYPYTLDGKHPSVGDALETFSILGVVAGATERLRLVTSVLVLPYRNPVLTAKVVASLDVLSGGRLTLGIGAGWLKEEFEALNSPAFNARGAVTDEWIAIFKQLWSQSPASFDGRFYQYTDIRCEPFPVQKPHPPIWVGGHSRAALRRTAWRWLAPGRRRRRLTVTAARDARASRHAEAADRSRAAKFLDADDLLQGAAL